MLVPMVLSAVLAAPSGRLENTVSPTAQRVHLTLDPAGEGYEGTVVIELDVAEKTQSFTLHAEELDIQDVLVGPVGGKQRVATYTTRGNRLTITSPRLLKPGQATVEIRFTNDFRTDQAGLYRTEEKGLPYLVTQFEADDARTAFPCFDEPSYKIPWTVELTTSPDLTTLSNMPLTTTAPVGEQVTHVFQTSPPMPSYLVALVVGPFEGVTLEAAVPITVYSPKGTTVQTAELRRQIPQHLDYLTGWFGSKLPYSKLDFVVVPEFAYGGMENVGLVVLADSMLLDPKTSTPRQVGTVAEVTAHEIAHMWFGNLVTMAWWDDLWLNESFASWMGLKARDAVLGDHPGRYSRVNRAFRAIQADGRSAMLPVRTEVDPENVFETTNFIAYPKGQAVLSMTEQWMGTAAFQKGLRAYMERHRFGNAKASDLFSALSAAGDLDVDALLVPYLDEPGAPLLVFTRTATGFDVAQERYTALGSELDTPHRWPVALVARTADGELRSMVDGAGGKLETRTPWLMPMANGVGYFAWEFSDPADLDALIAVAGELDPSEQMALVQNLKALVAAGRLDLGRELAMAGHLAGVVHPSVVRALLGQLNTAEEVVDTELEPAFAAYLRDTWGPRLETYGMEPVDGESPQIAETRELLVNWLGESGRHPDVLAYWAEATESFLDDPGSTPLGIMRTALPEHAKDQDLAFQALMLERGIAADNPQLRRLYLSAFASVGGESARATAMAWAMEEERNLEDLFTVVFTLYDDSDRHGDEALQWTIDNWASISKKIPAQYHGGMVRMGGGCSMERFEKARAFFEHPDRSPAGLERNVKSTEERVRACGERRATHRPSLAAFLQP